VTTRLATIGAAAVAGRSLAFAVAFACAIPTGAAHAGAFEQDSARAASWPSLLLLEGSPGLSRETLARLIDRGSVAGFPARPRNESRLLEIDATSRLRFMPLVAQEASLVARAGLEWTLDRAGRVRLDYEAYRPDSVALRESEITLAWHVPVTGRWWLRTSTTASRTSQGRDTLFGVGLSRRF
jgi:hypothetical protein